MNKTTTNINGYIYYILSSSNTKLIFYFLNEAECNGNSNKFVYHCYENMNGNLVWFSTLSDIKYPFEGTQKQFEAYLKLKAFS